jgi:hypothetical protein
MAPIESLLAYLSRWATQHEAGVVDLEQRIAEQADNPDPPDRLKRIKRNLQRAKENAAKWRSWEAEVVEGARAVKEESRRDG